MSSSLFSKLVLGSNFEFHVFNLIKKDFPECRIVIQRRLNSGLRPDFIIECEQKLIVIDAKAKEKLGRNDIDQVSGYIQETSADFGIIYVADFTEVSESIEQYAAYNAIEIMYTEWR